MGRTGMGVRRSRLVGCRGHRKVGLSQRTRLVPARSISVALMARAVRVLGAYVERDEEKGPRGSWPRGTPAMGSCDALLGADPARRAEGMLGRENMIYQFSVVRFQLSVRRCLWSMRWMSSRKMSPSVWRDWALILSMVSFSVWWKAWSPVAGSIGP